MQKQVLIFVFAFLAEQVSASTIKDPLDLAQEAQEELEELESIVQGEILAAHDDLEEIEYEFRVYTTKVLTEAVVSIQQEEETIAQQIATIKELAASANRDITSCTDIREELLGRLPDEYGDEVRLCVIEKNIEKTVIVASSRYIVDVSINKVYSLEFQLRQCSGDLLCISPLVTEIALDKIRLPQNIKTEVNSAKTISDTLRLSVDQCSTLSVTEYVSEANAVLQDLVDCANRILG